MFCTNRTAGGKQDGNIFSDDPDLGTGSVWSKKNVRKTKEDRRSERPIQRTPSAAAVREEAQREVRQARTISKPRKATAVPNKPRRQKLTREEGSLEDPVKGIQSGMYFMRRHIPKEKPDRVGGRGDYETVTLNGMERIRCGYCGAQNFVPVEAGIIIIVILLGKIIKEVHV